MSVSQNGWTDIPDYGPPLLTPLTVNGVPIAGGVRSGDVWTVAKWCCAVFNANIEALEGTKTAPKCWGYARIHDEFISNSNHESGTAWDLNAPKHPYGTSPSESFTADQIVKINSLIILPAGGVLRWGGTYGDPMHFEINADAYAVHDFALTLGDSTPPSPIRGLGELLMLTDAEIDQFINRVDDLAKAGHLDNYFRRMLRIRNDDYGDQQAHNDLNAIKKNTAK